MSETGTCLDCKYKDLTVFTGPCEKCNNWSKWEPKEDDMENENRNATATIDTEAELRKLQAKLDEANEYIDELNQKLQTARTELAVMRGMVDGLKFAMRCNGVSGGEVR